MRFITFLVLISLFFASGCGPLAKKFVRKRKRKKPQAVYVQPKDYPLANSQELYKDYYIYARGWMQELIVSLREKRSAKKIISCLQGIVENLSYLQEFFNEGAPLKDLLFSYIDKFSQMLSKFRRHSVSTTLWDKYLSESERIQREFEKKFSASKIFES